MERSEPTLVPEWLRTTGSVAGGGSSTHFTSSSHSDVPAQGQQARSRTSKSISDLDNPRHFLDRTSLSSSRRSSSNGSGKHAYSSFNRNNREKDREKEKERSNFGDRDHWDHDSTDTLGNMFASRAEKDALRRSHSMVYRKQVELFPRRVGDSKGSINGNHSNGNGILLGNSIVGSSHKAVFDQDFPSLGSEEKQGVPEIGRVSSPVLSTAVQNLPIGSSALIGSEGWTSALAEVPNVIGGSSTGPPSAPQIVAATAGSGQSSMATGLNMAEALAQAPIRTRTAPQLSVKTQRLEELAIKQSRQLIPVTPSMPKASVLNSSEKSKPKTPARAGELNVIAKNGPQQPSLIHPVNQSLRAGPVKSDSPKTTHGKFQVLKPVWENGITPPKDASSPTSSANSRAANSQLAAPPSAAPSSLRSPNNLNSSSVECKVAPLDLKSGPTLEKRPSLSQVQSRNDFFNLIKKKTSSNASTSTPDSGSINSPSTVEKSIEVNRDVVSAPSSPHTIQTNAEVTSNGNSSEEVIQGFSIVGEKGWSPSAALYPEEEEAAFLRSLGWEESSGEDEALTEEEINAFMQEYMKLKPSLKVCKGVQPKLSMLFESQGANLDGASSEMTKSLSDS